MRSEQQLVAFGQGRVTFPLGREISVWGITKYKNMQAQISRKVKHSLLPVTSAAEA